MLAGSVGLMHPVPDYLPHCASQLTREALQGKESREEGEELIRQTQRTYLRNHCSLTVTASLSAVAKS